MWKEWLKRLLTFEKAKPAPPVKPGLYHVLQEHDGAYTRFHLRVENDGSGTLIANAMAAARLTATGVLIAKDLLDGLSEDEIVRQLHASFSGGKDSTMHTDVAKVRDLIERIGTPSDAYPVVNLEDAGLSPYSSELIAPLQASVPLASPEIMAPLLDRLWEVGIPHITFLAPDGFEREHLIRAVERAEDLGMITGVRSRATYLNDADLLAELRQAGVDHITLPYAANDAEIHDALYGEGDLGAATQVLHWLEENQVCAEAEVPLVQITLDHLQDTVEGLIEQGADNLSFVAFTTLDSALAEEVGAFTSDGMAQVATTIEETADMAQARFMWNPPVEVDPAVPLADQIVAGPRCSGDVAVRVEPVGDVFPARGPYVSAGNLLREEWQNIWNHEVFRRYRERVEAPTRCDVCPELSICAADCPRDPHGWAQMPSAGQKAEVSFEAHAH
jgi:radical SAM protein with 4Fe4S-binding SPASM domain